VTSIRSIIGDPEYIDVRRQLVARMIEMLGLLVRDGTISNNQILQQLGIADDTKAKMAMMEEVRKIQSLNFDVLTKELDESKARNARMEEEKRTQSANLPLKSQKDDITAKASWMEEKNRNLEAKLASIEDEKIELEAKISAIEGEVDRLLLIAGLRPSQYLDLDARFEALGDELWALRASRE
jgi:hypothetical protein